MKKFKIVANVTIVTATLALAAYILWITHHYKPKPAYCERFRDTPASQVPAGCLRYWNPGR
jgi:hypothetical protein